jgi:uncharacterized protein
MADTVDVTISDNPDRHRYEALVDGAVAGFARYRLAGSVIDFIHTEVDDAFEGQGIGGRLASGALDDVRRRGLKVVATCPFIKSYIERHDAYQDLLAP